MNTLNVHLQLNDLHCFDEGDGIGSAEPYLWTVFFKIDGDTTAVTPALTLQGHATVVGRPGDHGDLPNHDVDAGEDVPIPAPLGAFDTQLKPIPLQQPLGGVTAVGGVVGVITVLMEEDDTPGSAVARGHAALNTAVQNSLNALIPTLNVGHQEPTDADIAAMTQRIGDTVKAAIKDGVSTWDWLKALGNMDDKIGSAVFRFSHTALESGGGQDFSQRFRNEGDWELRGHVSATAVNAAVGSLTVALRGTPAFVPGSPVHVSGPGGSHALNATATLGGLAPGTYTITASDFSTGLPSKPGCRLYSPGVASQHQVVAAGQTVSVAVAYTSAPCNA